MYIRFNYTYKSIKSLDYIKLPNFVLLTGLNGAGKTQLLEGISNNALSIIDEDSVLTNVQYVNLKNDDLYVERYSNANNDISLLKQRIIKEKIQEFNKNGTMSSGSSIQINIRYRDQINIDEYLKDIRQAAHDLNIDYTQFDYTHLNFWLSNYKSKSYPFEMINISRNFTAYYENYLRNSFNQFRNKTALTEKEFIQKFGPNPVDQFNVLLSKLNPDLELEYEKPEDFDVINYVQLKNKKTGDLMNFSDLSTGEKVFFKVLLTTYSNKENLLNVPQVLLLDEIDAGLHPSLMRQFLDNIMKIFVNDLGVNVFMTTHSPTTVALVDEESLFFVQNDLPRITKISKNDAISKLTEDIPMLNINYDYKKQVLVESSVDEKLYSKIYDILIKNKKIKETIPLSFIGTGSSKSDNTGSCTVVKEMCKQFLDNGNNQVYGIIDRDKNNKDKDNVFVLSGNKKYSIENCILDPLLISILLIKDGHNDRYGLGDIRFVDIRDLTQEQCQVLVDNILDRLGFEKNNLIEIKYCNDIIISLPNEFLNMQGHSLEEKYRTVFKEYKAEHNLKNRIINSVIKEYPDLCPFEFLDIFNKIIDS